MTTIDRDNQKQISLTHGGIMVYGKAAFSTTDLTVDVHIPLARAAQVIITPAQEPTAYERFYYSTSVAANGGIDLTIGRKVQNKTLQNGVVGAPYISSFNWSQMPVGYCPFDGTIHRVTVANITKGGGTPVFQLGNVISDGTIDVDDFMTGAGGTTVAMPSAGEYATVLGTSAAFDGTAGIAVAAGDLIIFSTNGGTTSNPAGLMCQVEISPTPTSALEMYYQVIGP